MRTIASGIIHAEARKANQEVVYFPEYVSAADEFLLGKEITIRRIKNGQITAPVHFINRTEAFIEFYFKIEG